MAQLQCSDIKMGCSDVVLFHAHRKKFRGNTGLNIKICTTVYKHINVSPKSEASL